MKELHLNFGHFELYQNHILGTIKEGVHFNLELNTILGKYLIDYYGIKRPVTYISNRKNHYSVDPMVHKHNTSYDCLKAIAIVENATHVMSTTEIESKFFKTDRLKAFKNTSDAITWCQRVLFSYH